MLHDVRYIMYIYAQQEGNSRMMAFQTKSRANERETRPNELDSIVNSVNDQIIQLSPIYTHTMFVIHRIENNLY